MKIFSRKEGKFKHAKQKGNLSSLHISNLLCVNLLNLFRYDPEIINTSIKRSDCLVGCIKRHFQINNL